MTAYREEKAFIEQISAAPHDDAPRLIFADWLEESGAPDRADFIRVQIERQSLPNWDRRQLPLWVRERALLKDHEPEWRNSLPKIDGVTWGKFRRGFVSSVTITDLARLNTLANECRLVTPVESISINWPGSRAPFDDSSPIEGLKELTLLDSPYLDGDEIDMIAWSPILTTLETLNVGQCNLADDGIRRLLNSTHLSNLKALRAPFNSIGNNGLDAILGSPSLDSLEELDVAEQESYSRYEEDPVIDESGVLSLVDWPGMNRIRSLNLSGNNIGSAALHALLQANESRNLQQLVLRDNGLEGAAMEAFAVAPSELRLQALDIGENYLSDIGAGFLAQAACLDDLKTLRLDRCELGRTSGILLADASLFYSLRKLDLNDNNLGGDGIQAILKRGPEELHTLQVANNDLLDEGAAFLASAPEAHGLQAIDLRNNGLGDASAAALAASEHLGQVLVLGLTNNQIDTSPTAPWMSSPLGNRLVDLDLTIQDDEGIPFSGRP